MKTVQIHILCHVNHCQTDCLLYFLEHAEVSVIIIDCHVVMIAMMSMMIVIFYHGFIMVTAKPRIFSQIGNLQKCMDLHIPLYKCYACYKHDIH